MKLIIRKNEICLVLLGRRELFVVFFVVILQKNKKEREKLIKVDVLTTLFTLCLLLVAET